MTPDQVYSKALQAGKRFPELEHLILTAGIGMTYLYTINIVKGRWIEAENIIAADACAAIIYAKEIIKERFEKAEKLIAKNSYCAYKYAADTIKGRFEKAEKLIACSDYNEAYIKIVFCSKPPADYASKSSFGLYLYAKNVLKGRLPTELHNRMLCFAIIETDAKHIKTYFKSKKYQ